MIKPIFRFVTRLSEDGDGLAIGVVMLPGRERFKPNTVYELSDCMGEIQMREVGESVVAGAGQTYKDSPLKVTWGSGLEDVMAFTGKYLFLS